MYAALTTLVLLSSYSINPVLGNAKRGIAFAEGDGSDIHNAQNGQASWIYNWAASPPSYIASSGLQYIPMQWGSGGANTFQSTVQSQGAHTILGFNEPNEATQSNMDPNSAAQIWKQFIQPLHNSGVKLGAPAVSAAPNGIPWLQQFFSACNGCTFDFIPLHWYGDGAQFFEQYVQNFANTFPGHDLWVTEWASTNPNDATATQFLVDTVRFLDSSSLVSHYSWFAFERDDGGANRFALLNSNGSKNQRGIDYL